VIITCLGSWRNISRGKNWSRRWGQRWGAEVAKQTGGRVLHTGIKKLVARLKKCIEKHGDYMEK
jgi:hypothetical protein